MQITGQEKVLKVLKSEVITKLKEAMEATEAMVMEVVMVMGLVVEMVIEGEALLALLMLSGTSGSTRI